MASEFHKIISFIKSGIRIIGCVLCLALPKNKLTALSTSFFIAEILGVLEEVKELDPRRP